MPIDGIRTFAGKWIEVSKQNDGSIEILYENKKLPYLKASNKDISNINREDEDLLNLMINA